METLNQRLALVLFCAAALAHVTYSAIKLGNPLLTGFVGMALMFQAFVSVLAITEVMKKW